MAATVRDYEEHERRGATINLSLSPSSPGHPLHMVPIYLNTGYSPYVTLFPPSENPILCVQSNYALRGQRLNTATFEK
jgi:hypothetical protein